MDGDIGAWEHALIPDACWLDRGRLVSTEGYTT